MIPANIMAKIERDEDCWLWRGEFRRVPIIKIGRGCSRAARRHIYELVNGPLPADRFTACACPDPRCVAPGHTAIVSRRGYMQLARKRGCYTTGAVRSIRSAVARRRKSSMTIEKARAVRRRRAEGERTCVLAREYGISHAMVYRIEHNKVWREIDGLAGLMLQARML